MWVWLGIFLGGWLIGSFLSGRPALTFFTLGFFLLLALLLVTYPVLAWWLFIAVLCILAASLVLWVIWAFLPFILGFILGVFILYGLIITLPIFLRSIG